jgi:hypothetical protein
MKVLVEARTYELHDGEWVEHPRSRRPAPSIVEHVIAAIATAFAIAVIAAIGILAAALTLVIAPIALCVAVGLRFASSIRARRAS